MNITRLRRRAAWGLWTEVVLRAAAPGCAVLVAYLAAALFGFGGPWLFGGVLLVAGASVGIGLSRLQPPGGEAIDRRIERASGLRHRPLAVLEDEPENDGALAAAIWQIHQRRTAHSLTKAKAGRPVIDAAAHDPWALRGLLLLLLLAGVVVAGPAKNSRIAGAFNLPDWPFAGPVVTVWVSPPGYAASPPEVLTPGEHLSVLAGSGITVIVNGDNHAPPAKLGGTKLVFDDMTTSSHRVDAVLTAPAKLSIGPWWHRLAAWNIDVVAPDAPAITLTNAAVGGHQLALAWHATDRYGLQSLSATLLPIGHPQAAPEVLALPLMGADPHDESGAAKPDIGSSPYAGLWVSLTLNASNLAGVGGHTAPVSLLLPPPDLQDKTALALAALRQRLALDPKEMAPVAEALKALAQAPPSPITAAADLKIAALATAMSLQETSADAAREQLAALSQEVEAGQDFEPAQALAAANRALEQALQQALNGGQLNSGALQSLLDAMHAALARHLQAVGNGASSPGSPEISPSDLDRMAEQIAKDEAAGQTARAAAELRQLEQTLAALQSAKPMSAAQAAQSAAANQAAQALGQMTQGEAALLDQTNQGTATAAEQGALQDRLSATQQILSQARIKLPGLADAAGAMGQARKALGQQDQAGAAGAEGYAIQGLQKAAAALASAHQGVAFGEGGQPYPDQNTLGEGINGAPDEDPVPGLMPSAGDAAGVIQQQIIRKDADPALPEAVYQYYQRLLNGE